MRSKLTILTLFIVCCASIAKAQTPSQKAFMPFAKLSDDQREAAYQKRDAKAYLRLADEFVANYEKLSTDDQKYFKGNYINAYYNLSCTYALTGDKKDAVIYLEKSVKAGMTDVSHMQIDTDLDNIRNESGYINVVNSLREANDYLYILHKASRYNYNDKRELPEFTYQSAAEPNLVTLRRSFKLDSIAGTGNDVSRIINLLHWVHNVIPHDGNHDNPVVKNAMSMIAVCKKESRGLNCRGLATVLNECYLSLGYQSRFITCMPKDSLKVDNDCHVINMVYVNSLKKWIWIDPTNDAYVMDEQGTLLSIEEVRNRVINNKPLIVNPDANWNHKESVLKAYYLFYYMAKNLYLLECPLNSEYDAETREPGKRITYIQLLPLDYFNQGPDKDETVGAKSKSVTIIYKTNNPAAFWKAPPATVSTAVKVN